MCISVVAGQWGQGFHLESNGGKGCVWRKGRRGWSGTGKWKEDKEAREKESEEHSRQLLSHALAAP